MRQRFVDQVFFCDHYFAQNIFFGPNPCNWSMWHLAYKQQAMLWIASLRSSCVCCLFAVCPAMSKERRLGKMFSQSAKWRWGGWMGVAGQEVSSGSRVLDSKSSHHWKNHQHCPCLHPRISDKMAWLQKKSRSVMPTFPKHIYADVSSNVASRVWGEKQETGRWTLQVTWEQPNANVFLRKTAWKQLWSSPEHSNPFPLKPELHLHL